MNEPSPPDLGDYIQRLGLPPESAARLLAEATAGGGDAAARFDRLHRLLAGARDDGADPLRASLALRLSLALARATRRGGERSTPEQVRLDGGHGDPRLATMPPLHRASFTTRRWSPNPLLRLWRWLDRQLFGDRGQLTARGGADTAPDAPPPSRPWRAVAALRRGVLLALVLGQSWAATYYMTAVLPYHGRHALEIPILILYAVLFAWVSAGFWTAMMGFLQLLIGKDRYSIEASAAADLPLAEDARTAIVMPICNEDVRRVFAGLRATYDSVARTGQLAHFDFYILSDSNDPDSRVGELAAWLRLCREVGGFGRIHYRRRTHRIKRKSGNIADFCRRWGSLYRYMVILDADSVMSGPCLVRLTQLMEANPGAGIIQSAPRASGRETLYARIQQFATRVYGPLFTAGLHFWQLGESHYWGHNAILRVAPFIRHCALPRLPGRGALSGEILSHDFVEAALMRRAGWSVWIAYGLPGSYEEMPPNLLDELKRDRRWCLGNLMNFRLFLASGLHPAHRAVFMTGVMAYLSAPLWFASLLLSTALLAVQVLAEPTYFTAPYQLFPSWPEWHPEWALALFSATATLLFFPKILSVILILAQGARNYGGGVTVTLSMLMELLFSALLAPIRMLFHAHFVVAALLGIGIVWKSPPRDDSQTPWSEAIARHGPGTVLGIGWAGLVYWLNPAFLWWLLPVVGALILAIPLSVWSSKVSLGRRFRSARLFLIPEEAVPPRELRWTSSAFRRAPAPPGFVDAVVDPLVNAIASADGKRRPIADARSQAAREALIGKAATEGPAALGAAERHRLLGNPASLAALHRRLWTDAAALARWQAPAPGL